MNTIPKTDTDVDKADDITDTAVAPEPPTCPRGLPDSRDPRDLDEHYLSRKLFPDGLGSDEENQELLASVEKLQRSPILITGTGCQDTPPNVVLDGRRVRRAAVKAGLETVQVLVFDNLTEDQQAEVIVHANLAAGMARRLDERQKAALEHYLLERIGKRQGQRTSSAGEGSAAARGAEWPVFVSEELKGMDPSNDVTPNAIRERHLIFYSPVSPELLKTRVNDGTITRKEAVARVREALKEPEVVACLKDAREKELSPDQVALVPAVVAAKNAIFGKLESGGKSKRQPTPKATKEKMAEGIILDGTSDIDNFLGRRVQVEIHGGHLVLLDKGESDSDASIYRPDKPVTKSCWAIDVAAAVDCLPGELRSQVTVSEVERLDPVKCACCGGTIWRWAGGCAKCDRAGDGFVPTMNLRLPRQRIRLTTPKGDLDVVFWPDINHYMVWVPAGKVKEGITLGAVDVCPIQVDSTHCDDSRRALRDKIRLALMKLLGPAPAAPPEGAGHHEMGSEAGDAEAERLVEAAAEEPVVATAAASDDTGLADAPPTNIEAASGNEEVTEQHAPMGLNLGAGATLCEAAEQVPALVAGEQRDEPDAAHEATFEAAAVTPVLVVAARSIKLEQVRMAVDATAEGSQFRLDWPRYSRSRATSFYELCTVGGRMACLVVLHSRGLQRDWRSVAVYEADGASAPVVGRYVPSGLSGAVEFWLRDELGLRFEAIPSYWGGVVINRDNAKPLVIVEGPFPRKSLPYEMRSRSSGSALATDWPRIGKSPLAEVYTISGVKGDTAILIAHRRTGGRAGWDKAMVYQGGNRVPLDGSAPDLEYAVATFLGQRDST